MRAEQVPERLQQLADALLAGRDSPDYLAAQLREAAEALEGDVDRPDTLDAQRHAMRYLDSARTQLEQSDDLERPAVGAADVRYAIERSTLVGRAVDDLIDAVHALNGSTSSEARELVEQQELRERHSPAARRARGLEPIRPARRS